VDADGQHRPSLRYVMSVTHDAPQGGYQGVTVNGN